MVYQKIKNFILLIMVIVCVFLSSQVWLQLPDFLVYDSKKDDTSIELEKPEIDIWNVVRPLKKIIQFNGNYTVLYSDSDYNLWENTMNILENSLKSYSLAEDSENKDAVVFPKQYLKFDFATKVPMKIFTGQFEIESKDLDNNIKYIKNIIIDLDNKHCIYIYNGEDTFKLENEIINTDVLSKIVANIDFNQYTKYSTGEKVGDSKIEIPVPLEETALNPVFVQSELDVFNADEINKIAKEYFQTNYEYVRKVVEMSGNRIYMYRTEKVLKVSQDGQLDFYDSGIEFENNHDVYDSFLTALVFIENFLGFPEEGYLGDIENIQYEGNYGYKFTFSYKIYNRPIMFSKVRENAALEIEVVDGKVISYKRFIRNVDDAQKDKIQNVQVLPAVEVLKKNLQDSVNSIEGAALDNQELKVFKSGMISSIKNIYLGYFDLSRVNKEQNLRVVWVFEMEDKSYIFNAITGALIEEW